MKFGDFFKARAVTAVWVGSRYYNFENNRIVATIEEWSTLRSSSNTGSVGCSSYNGQLLPVFDLDRLRGTQDARGGKLAIVDTTDGYIGVVADGVVALDSGTVEPLDVSSLTLRAA